MHVHALALISNLMAPWQDQILQRCSLHDQTLLAVWLY
jgi:hypothetical protein